MTKNSKRRWVHERRRDPYHKKSIEMGYRSRAVFKLMEIDEKFHLLHEGNTVLDLGCSPGSWSQYSLWKVGSSGFVYGVDTRDMKSLQSRRFNFIKMDIMDDQSIEKLRNAIGRTVDVVISDLSPNMSGIYDIDLERQLSLARRGIEIAINMLRRGGKMILKVFEGKGSDSIQASLSRYFIRVVKFKPKASRKRSSEFYLVCSGFTK